VGTSLAGDAWNNRTVLHHERLTERASVDNPLFNQQIGSLVRAAVSFPAPLSSECRPTADGEDAGLWRRQLHWQAPPPSGPAASPTSRKGCPDRSSRSTSTAFGSDENRMMG
jgi:hypothetical protein